MGYYSNVALALTAKGAQAMRTAINNLDTETNMLVTDFITYAETHAFDPDSKAEAFLWQDVKWYDDCQDVDFLEQFMRRLDDDDYRFVRIGENDDDTEVRGDFYDNPFDLGLSREITFDNHYAV